MTNSNPVFLSDASNEQMPRCLRLMYPLEAMHCITSGIQANDGPIPDATYDTETRELGCDWRKMYSAFYGEYLLILRLGSRRQARESRLRRYMANEYRDEWLFKEHQAKRLLKLESLQMVLELGSGIVHEDSIERDWESDWESDGY